MPILASPTDPVAGETVTLEAQWPGAGVEYPGDVLYELTARPPESSLPLGFLLAEQTGEDATALIIREKQNQLDKGNTVSQAANRFALRKFSPDVPGKYDLTARLYTAAHRRQLDPAFDLNQALEQQAATGSEFPDVWTVREVGTVTETIDVGGYTELPILRGDGEGATLRLEIHGEEIRAATIINPTSDNARLAALQTSVRTPLGLLVGEDFADIVTDPDDAVNDLRESYEGHRVDPVHVTDDDTNEVLVSDSARTTVGALYLFGQVAFALRNHLLDSTAATPNSWHTDDDLKNLATTATPGDLAQLTVSLADWRLRVYARHIVQDADPAVHQSADTNNTLTVAAGLLDDLIVAYLDALESQTAAPTGESVGLKDAITLAGFRPAA